MFCFHLKFEEPAYVALGEALADSGGSPCWSDPDRHRAEDDPATAEALDLCSVCPVLAACRMYALAAQEPHGA